MAEVLASGFASGRLVDLILVLVAIEAVALMAWRRGRGPSAIGLLANLASGAGLMLALRAALTGAHWTAIAACLLAALCAHGVDLALRLRGRGPTQPAPNHPASLGRRPTTGRTGTA